MTPCPEHPDGCPGSPASMLVEAMLATGDMICTLAEGEARLVVFAITDPDTEDMTACMGARGYGGAEGGQPGTVEQAAAITADVYELLQTIAHGMGYDLVQLPAPRARGQG